MTSFTEAVHEELKGTGVSVTVLCPGFTRTEFQVRADVPAGEVPGFMWQEAPEVARAGLDGLAKNRAVVIPGTANKVLGNSRRLRRTRSRAASVRAVLEAPGPADVAAHRRSMRKTVPPTRTA